MSEILERLRRLYAEQGDAIEQWMVRVRDEAAPYIYSSVDLRHSGPRLAPVDTNLFPAGFNNLSPRARMRASRYFAQALAEHAPGAKRVAIVPENHTRNLAYLDNLAVLASILEQAGFEVAFGSLIAPPGAPIALQAPQGRDILELPLVRSGDTLSLEGGFTPDIVLLNNDLTAGPQSLLEGLRQPVLPPPALGWHQRRKSMHFDNYRRMAQAFCAAFSLDPWLLSAYFTQCGRVDFKERSGLDRVARAVDALIEKARAKHRDYGIADDPYVFVKADSGTYGMGIMTVRSGEEMLSLNKKDRNKMQTIKEGAHVSEIILQEGVTTIDRVDGKTAEPMIYLVDGLPVGGMWRINGGRDATANLNAAGMEFTGMCDETEERDCPDMRAVVDCHFRSFGLVAALAALSAGREDYNSYAINL